jgi:hypothetical protein
LKCENPIGIKPFTWLNIHLKKPKLPELARTAIHRKNFSSGIKRQKPDLKTVI